jgi:voltage-gated potassium channel Kch
MLENLAIGSMLLIFTSIIHAGGMLATMRILQRFARRHAKRTTWNRLYVIVGAVWLMFAATLVEMLVWAETYIVLGEFTAIEPALYFSTVTFTTVGFGDVVLDDRWRLLSALEAANGIIMFGWTTAIVLYAVQRVYVSKNQD